MTIRILATLQSLYNRTTSYTILAFSAYEQEVLEETTFGIRIFVALPLWIESIESFEINEFETSGLHVV